MKPRIDRDWEKPCDRDDGNNREGRNTFILLLFGRTFAKKYSFVLRFKEIPFFTRHKLCQRNARSSQKIEENRRGYWSCSRIPKQPLFCFTRLGEVVLLEVDSMLKRWIGIGIKWYDSKVSAWFDSALRLVFLICNDVSVSTSSVDVRCDRLSLGLSSIVSVLW